jgi:SAM-dependent methyltransferase
MKNKQLKNWDSSSKLLLKLTKEEIAKNLSNYVGEKCPQSLFDTDYEIYECKETGLQFSYPMKAGSGSFYDWIVNKKFYYNSKRWEWNKIVELLNTEESKEYDYLEIGCGSGIFLNIMHNLDDCNAFGIDMSSEPILKCKNKGLNAICGLIEDTNFEKKFKYVGSYHVLEHVEDPVDLVKKMLDLITDDGSVFISTPYSPMSIESNWHDPLNYPPHHLSRWNYKAYTKLAKILNCEIEFYFPKSDSLLKRTVLSLKMQVYGTKKISKYQLIFKILIHPIKLLNEFITQAKREKINGIVTADVVLVRLKRK